MSQHAVVIAGGGPTGLMLAGELALAGVDVGIVERRASQELESTRAGGLHARTIEVLDQRGIAERFLAQGRKMQVASFALTPLDISDSPTRHNYGLPLSLARRRTGAQHRCPGCCEPRLEAGPGGARKLGREPPRQLPRRAASGRCPRASRNHGPDRDRPRRRAHGGVAREPVRSAEDGRASQAVRRDDVGARHPVRARERAPAARPANAGSRGADRRWTAARLHLLHEARPVLLHLGESGALDIAPWADRVRRVDARYAGWWELPVLGAVAAPTAVLIRPDGHVAWVGEGTDQGLAGALTTWFGAPLAALGRPV